MISTPSRLRRVLILALFPLTVLVPAVPAGGGMPAPPAPTVTAPRTVLPPVEYSEGEPIPQPRTRQDRIVSALAPIAMVAVLVAGLYVYWLIRKGL